MIKIRHFSQFLYISILYIGYSMCVYIYISSYTYTLYILYIYTISYILYNT